MPFFMIRQDITKMQVDAIVNAANPSLLGGGGVDGAIHRAAGPGLLEECRTLGGCSTGNAKITAGYDLPAKYVIHTVGPIYRCGMSGEAILLASCYRSSLQLALDNECESVAFPLISAGVYGYPRDEAIRIAIDTIRTFLGDHDDCMTVYLVLFDRSSTEEARKLYPDLASYIDDRYAAVHTDARPLFSARQHQAMAHFEAAENYDESKEAPPAEDLHSAASSPKKPAGGTRFNRKSKAVSEEKAAPQMPSESVSMLSLEQRIAHADESFSQMLLRKIDEAGMTDAQCYKKANIDRKLFSKIRSDKNYKPSKQTVLAFAIALQMPLDETRKLLQTAGFALSRASEFDIIVEYFIECGNYDVFAINEALFAFDQSLLGA